MLSICYPYNHVLVRVFVPVVQSNIYLELQVSDAVKDYGSMIRTHRGGGANYIALHDRDDASRFVPTFKGSAPYCLHGCSLLSTPQLENNLVFCWSHYVFLNVLWSKCEMKMYGGQGRMKLLKNCRDLEL